MARVIKQEIHPQEPTGKKIPQFPSEGKRTSKIIQPQINCNINNVLWCVYIIMGVHNHGCAIVMSHISLMALHCNVSMVDTTS